MIIQKILKVSYNVILDDVYFHINIEFDTSKRSIKKLKNI